MASYTPLEPSITQSLNLPGVTFSTDTAVSFFTSVSLLWTLGIVACVAAAGFVWVRGGLYRMEASEAGIRKSNDEFKRGSLGLLGVMALFLIIYTVNKGLLLGEISLTELRVNGGGVGVVNTTQPTTNGTTPTAPATGTTGTGAANLATLNNAGIQINRNNTPCTAAQMQERAPPCTSLEGLPQVTITMLLSLRTACPACVIVVTGGTEPGHTTHGIGRRPVDLQLTPSLMSFIQANGRAINASNWAWGGFTFYNEPAGATSNTTGAHFHVY